MHRIAVALLACLLLPVALAQESPPAGTDAGKAVVVTDGQGGITVAGPAYNATLAKPSGNLASLSNDRGYRLLGDDGGGIQGMVVRWNGQTQQDGGLAGTITVDGTTVTVQHEAFTETYQFLPDRVAVTVEAGAAATALQPLTVVAASLMEPSREAALRFSQDAYPELGAYPTDYFTDESEGQFSLWTTALYTVAGHTYRPYMLEPVLSGRCTWETQYGEVRFLAGQGHSASSPLYREQCTVAGETDLEVAGTVVVPGRHQVWQTFENLTAGDTLAFGVEVDSRGYDVVEALYPISSRVTAGANTGLTSAKLVVPWDKPADGYKLVMYAPGHWDTKYTHSYLWDFLGNHGYLVAVPFTTADMGQGHQRDDWGYIEQVEIDELRRWVVQEYDVDADRVYANGVSLGGLNSILAAVNHPDAYAATLYYSGVYDFVRFWIETPLGAASYPLGVENARCCGLPTEHPYEYSIRNPKDRIGQLSGGLFIVQGVADAVAPPDHAIELSQAVPGSELHLAAGAHENNVFAGFRKEALAFLESQDPRPAAMRDVVDVQVYGHPEMMPYGYERFADRHNYSTEWMTVWVEDHAYTRVQAERTDDGYSVRVDRPATVALRVPDACVPLCNATLGGTALTISNHTFLARDRAVVFEAQANATYSPEFQPYSLPLPPAPEKQSPGPVWSVLAASVVVGAIMARRRRRDA